MNANTELYDRTVDRAAMVRMYERRSVDKIRDILDDHQVDSEALIKSHTKLSNKIVRDFEELQTKNYSKAYRASRNSLLDLFSDQVSYNYQKIESVFGKIWNTRKVPKVVGDDVVLKQPLVSNKLLSESWAGVSLNERKRLELLIRKGIAENKSIDEIALEVRKGNVHNISRHQARALVVTSTTSVIAQADHAVYMANEKAIRGYQYIAILDSRTTPICAARSGQIFPVEDTVHLPPAHINCRSVTVPVFKSWEDISKLEAVAQVRRDNLRGLTKAEIAFFDGQTPLKENYGEWLRRQPTAVQLRHLGDYKKVDLLNKDALTIDGFTTPEGAAIGIRELRAMSEPDFTIPGDSKRFASARLKLDSMQLGISRPEDLYNNDKLRRTLLDYYKLQSAELDGVLSYTNYRGQLIGTKKLTRRRVLTSPPTEDQLKYNPITGRYEDVRLYQPNPAVLENALKLANDSNILLPKDKKFIVDFINSLQDSMNSNERAVIANNLRIIFGRYRENKEPWGNFKAVVQGQIKFDVMNVSESLETQLRRDSDVLKKLLQNNYIDPVLGPSNLQELHDSLISNIFARNKWEDSTAPKIGRELRTLFDNTIFRKAPLVWKRLSEDDIRKFYLRFAQRLAMADSPDKDALAVYLGRDLYNMANLNGAKREWLDLGNAILETKGAKKFYEVETFGVQKRRMTSMLSGSYFGPYYDTVSYNIRIVDPRIQEYAKLVRKVEVGLRVPSYNGSKLLVRPGYKTYFVKGAFGYKDTRIPITSSSSFSDFPIEMVDESLANALNWASQTRYRIDYDYYNFVNKLLYFEDDRGNARFYNERNEYRKYIASRGDAYERFKTMEWLTQNKRTFSNTAFVDHRARIYDRGLISPQSGETFRPFLNTEIERNFSSRDFKNLQDQIGSFLGGINDSFEGRFDSLTITGRQKIAEKWRADLVELGNHMLRGKPADIRAVITAKITEGVDGEELGKLYRFAIEMAKIDKFLGGNYSEKSLQRLSNYKTALALEQDASSSGAQIIALTTRNRRLAELSNVIPTTQKKRLYDEIARATYNDPEFKRLNQRLGLSEKDLRKAAKAQNMVTFYGAGERTGALNVEGKISKVLEKRGDVLVVKLSERDTVLDEISARIARYEKFDPDTAEELRRLRATVKDIFNKGTDPGDDILEQLYFLQPQTREFVEKLSRNYSNVVTPADFKEIASIMSGYLEQEVPILKDFTKFFGRLASDFIANAKPSNSNFDWKAIAKGKVLGGKTRGYVLPDRLSEFLGIKAGEPVSEKFLRRFSFYKPGTTLYEIINGVDDPLYRVTGAKYLKKSIYVPTIDLEKGAIVKKVDVIDGFEILKANKLPKSWTNVPWVNFDGKTIEQNFTQSYDVRIGYRDAQGQYVNNIIKIQNKSNASWWDEMSSAEGKINDIADIGKARTAFAVNGNHSNDAVLVKKFHLWGRSNKIPTSTIHDAFFSNVADMLPARQALREIYAQALNKNIIKETLDEMLARGLPRQLYDKYLQEAIELGLIPVPGKSRVGGKSITDKDILNKDDILKEVPADFKEDYGWYGVG